MSFDDYSAYRSAQIELAKRKRTWEELEEIPDIPEHNAMTTETASVKDAIPMDNKGFAMLQKMGWQKGTGLGREKTGIVEPVQVNVKTDSLGLGKDSEYDMKGEESTARRKALEVEIQAAESLSRKQRREEEAQKKEAITKELEGVRKEFFCECCNKQYSKVGEFNVHLSSYDHQHRQRFFDMKNMMSKGNSKESDRNREEKKYLKMMKKRQEMSQPPLPPEDEPKPRVSKVSFSFGKKQ